MTVEDLYHQCKTLIDQGMGYFRVYVDFDREGGNENEARGLVSFTPFWSKVKENFKLE